MSGSEYNLSLQSVKQLWPSRDTGAFTLFIPFCLVFQPKFIK